MSEAAHQTAGPDGSRGDGGDDAAVIARSLRSPECFGAIFHRHAPVIYRYIARRLGPDSDVFESYEELDEFLADLEKFRHQHMP
jgi:hypothetical protein